MQVEYGEYKIINFQHQLILILKLSLTKLPEIVTINYYEQQIYRSKQCMFTS